jgi:hypothetical protein
MAFEGTKQACYTPAARAQAFLNMAAALRRRCIRFGVGVVAGVSVSAVAAGIGLVAGVACVVAVAGVVAGVLVLASINCRFFLK